MTPQELAALIARIDELEMKQAFQEQTIDDLNAEIAAHQLTLEKMRTQMKFLVERVRSVSGSNIAKDSEETPPPHY
uniref:SlyX family protein n=1 Tax=Thaumasiovibrio occultus TaxID=1891184 RepID=UPI000B35D4CE|nr:SlyX family protein [Thaumasiovibrio occultus]